MFNVGGGEVLVILLVALIVLGPQRLPDATRKVGRAMGELRRMSQSFQDELRTALDEPDVPAPSRPAPVRDPGSAEIASAITAATDNAEVAAESPAPGPPDDQGDADARAAS